MNLRDRISELLAFTPSTTSINATRSENVSARQREGITVLYHFILAIVIYLETLAGGRCHVRLAPAVKAINWTSFRNIPKMTAEPTHLYHFLYARIAVQYGTHVGFHFSVVQSVIQNSTDVGLALIPAIPPRYASGKSECGDIHSIGFLWSYGVPSCPSTNRKGVCGLDS